MTERPIIFSGPMVRALLDGSKTQTRRVLKKQPPVDVDLTGCEWRFTFGYKTTKANPPYMEATKPWPSSGKQMGNEIIVAGRRVLCRVGDLLYVRENFARVGDEDDDIHACPDLRTHVYFMADAVDPERQKWRPSIHMPRAASRLTLEVTDVRVERVQDISEDDASAEGVFRDDERPEEHDYRANSHLCPQCAGTGLHNGLGPNMGVMFDIDCSKCDTPKKKFRNLWNYINEGRGFGWNENPWVAAVTFKVHHKNINALLSERGAA